MVSLISSSQLVTQSFSSKLVTFFHVSLSLSVWVSHGLSVSFWSFCSFARPLISRLFLFITISSSSFFEPSYFAHQVSAYCDRLTSHAACSPRKCKRKEEETLNSKRKKKKRQTVEYLTRLHTISTYMLCHVCLETRQRNNICFLLLFQST